MLTSTSSFSSSSSYNALVCDLDGTLLHAEQEAIAVPGRTRASFLSADAALLLAKISRIFPVVIATGRNAMSVHKLVSQLPDVEFSGFVLENGFVVKHGIYASNNSSSASDISDSDIDDSKIAQNRIDDSEHSGDKNSFAEWDKIAALFPDWERLPFYENCVGFIFSSGQTDSPLNQVDIDSMAQYAEIILMENGYNHPVYKEKRKIFIYPGHVDKTRGLAFLGVHPYIAMGDGSNDLQMMEQSTLPVMPDSGVNELKEIVMQKKGFCSMQSSHRASFEMLEFAYEKIKAITENKAISEKSAGACV
ncbi:MAG: HAD hydrolase family protein [Desulfamplus sp.]|nr:HAD hydrolase family protein [Desulfamplus sp.]